jgi:hypothetical protein
MRGALPNKLKINVAVLDEDFEIHVGEKGSEWVKEMMMR